MADDEMLYGVPGAEVLWDDPAACWEAEIDPYWADSEAVAFWTIEEWSVYQPAHHLPHRDVIVECVCEMIADCGEVSEGAADAWEDAARDPEVQAALDAWLTLWASKIGWRQADRLLRTLTVTRDSAGEPLLDGEPMYVKEADRG